ncbi:hypothetical protein XELAEV_18002026mg [Xenopus laevis]|uniref:Uncharacterized protein n=1 Tax=Xenopus laevis TaxID=8355 RepID=A0A974BNT4_XENLA|nr:hypothetical protein XELAEV_18002026mg [Xenopus laevis]
MNKEYTGGEKNLVYIDIITYRHPVRVQQLTLLPSLDLVMFSELSTLPWSADDVRIWRELTPNHEPACVGG